MALGAPLTFDTLKNEPILNVLFRECHQATSLSNVLQRGVSSGDILGYTNEQGQVDHSVLVVNVEGDIVTIASFGNTGSRPSSVTNPYRLLNKAQTMGAQERKAEMSEALSLFEKEFNSTLPSILVSSFPGVRLEYQKAAALYKKAFDQIKGIMVGEESRVDSILGKVFNVLTVGSPERVSLLYGLIDRHCILTIPFETLLLSGDVLLSTIFRDKLLNLNS